MKIRLPDDLACKWSWCGEKTLDLVDVWNHHEEDTGFVLVVMHCTSCNWMMESMAPVLDGEIHPRPEKHQWRSTHNEIHEWPYGEAVKVGHRRVFHD
jgi:hypothetical protein